MSGFCCGCCGCVEEAEVGILEECGKFSKTIRSGCFCVNPCFCQTVRGRVSLRVRQLDVNVETKTKDNVFVKVVVSVQYYVESSRVRDAFYKLTNPSTQMTSFVYDVVRSTVPKMTLDETFESKEDIAREVLSEVAKSMESYGYTLTKTLVTDIDPDPRVKAAMNEINAAQRLREAAKDKAEAQKITIVKQAEADAESKYLAGTGIARQRKAIMEGLRNSVVEFSGSVNDTTPRDAIELLLMTQYFDTLKELGESGTRTLFVPSGPGAVSQIGQELRTALLQANEVARR